MITEVKNSVEVLKDKTEKNSHKEKRVREEKLENMIRTTNSGGLMS